MVDAPTYLPLQKIVPNKKYFSKKVGGGSAPKEFVDESDFIRHRDALYSSLDFIEKDFGMEIEKFGRIHSILKAVLQKDALAKSHRPRDLLTKETCPVIGVGELGTLFLSTSKAGIENLKKKVKEPSTPRMKSNVTAINKFERFGKKDKLHNKSFDGILQKSKRKEGYVIKTVLFDHHDEEINRLAEKSFQDYTKSLNLSLRKISFFDDLHIWSVTGQDPKALEEVIDHPAVKKMSFFPKYHIIKSKSLVLDQAVQSKFPQPVKGKEYPVVGLIDSGVDEKHGILSPWVVAHERKVPNDYANHEHGTFVGGLLIMPQQLNGVDICPEADPVQVVDYHVLPNSDKDKGLVDNLYEDQLMIALNEDLPELSKKFGVKVWNISLGFDKECADDEWSELAVFLDDLQDENDLLFVVAAGNYVGEYQRTWPPQKNVSHEDRITVPADSIRALTVGALACREKPGSIVHINEPTSYSRKGPGPSSSVKPELVHYSGNLSITNSRPNFDGQGIISFDPEGNLVENVGTSFSTPLVSRLAAQVYHHLNPKPSVNLMKALLIHNAFLPQPLGRSEECVPYVGFGMPRPLNAVLACTKHSATLIFEDELHEAYVLNYPFVWPKSLLTSSGKFRGKVEVTLVSQPPLDEQFGSEYCRANVTASLQCWARLNDKSQPLWAGRLLGDPDESDLSKLYEREQIKNLFKWSPVKRYAKKFRGITAKEWRLQVELLLREGVSLKKPVRFAMIVTISDPDEQVNVYDEVVKELRARGIATQELRLQEEIRQRFK